MKVSEMTHDDLVLRGERWLKSNGCSVIFRDPFRAATSNGEQPDAIGWRDGVSVLIEAKASRADFLSDKNKNFRKVPKFGMGEWRFYICPPGIIKIEDLPEGWGLLYALPKQIKKVHGVPPNTQWHNKKPFLDCAKNCEMQLLISACRRMEIRGHLKEIYDGMPGVEK